MYLKKKVADDLIKFRSPHFPYRKKVCKSFRYGALIGIGGNMGDTLRLFERVFFHLKRSPLLEVCQTSSILKNPPFGYLDQPFFYNAVIVLKSDMQPRRLLRYLQHVEKRFGRKRSFKDAPRTLDLDILFYENKKIETPELTIPHKEWYKRDSVTIPLMEVAL